MGQAPQGLGVFATTTWQQSEFANGANDGKDTLYVPNWIANGGIRYHDPSGLYGVFEGHYWGASPWSCA